MIGHSRMSDRFESEIWPHAALVLRVARLLTSRYADAEDLAQETLLKAYRGLNRFSGENPQGWLLAILRNAHIDRLRGKDALATAVAVDDQMAAAEALEDVRWDDPAAMLERFSDEQVIAALQELPLEIRWALLLVDVEGLDGKAAAEVMQVPEGTVKSRLHRGRAMLRQKLAGLEPARNR
jgi:RNA polymerase sigma-70 factor (ECF subfamily)